MLVMVTLTCLACNASQISTDNSSTPLPRSTENSKVNSRTDVDHPPSFKNGVQVLLLMLRAKDGGSARTDRKAAKKIITQSPTEFDEALVELRALWRPNERIYSTINPRSIDKAIRLFKYRQLDADYFAERDRNSFYCDLENRWISCLKDAKASLGSLFLFDWDFDIELQIPIAWLNDELERHTKVVEHYPTRNGRHFITEPFNPNLLANAAKPLLHRNALMLWSY